MIDYLGGLIVGTILTVAAYEIFGHKKHYNDGYFDGLKDASNVLSKYVEYKMRGKEDELH